jgi:hypothetical protein
MHEVFASVGVRIFQQLDITGALVQLLAKTQPGMLSQVLRLKGHEH